jgi:hypothetical protein
VGVFETKVYAATTDNSEELWHQMKQFARSKKHMESSNACQFLFHTELGHVSKNMGAEVINNSFVCLPLICNPLTP